MNERCDRSREQIDQAVADILSETIPNMLNARLLDVAIEVLLDIRETLYRLERDKTNKWGSKL